MSLSDGGEGSPLLVSPRRATGDMLALSIWEDGRK
jgi:hypothetical protein